MGRMDNITNKWNQTSRSSLKNESDHDVLAKNTEADVFQVTIPSNIATDPETPRPAILKTFDQAFELAGYGKFNFIVILTAGLLLLHSTMELQGMGYILPAATCNLELTHSQQVFISSATLIGCISSLILSGYLSDLYGRRTVILSGVFLGSLVSALSGLCMKMNCMAFFRIITGGLLSASSASIFVYVSEMNCKKHRTSAIAWSSMFIPLAMVLIPALEYYILPLGIFYHIVFFDFVPWRLIIWTWPIFGLLGAILLLWLPESPRYLYNREPRQKSLQVLAFIYATNNDMETDDFPVKSLAVDKPPQNGEFKQMMKDILLIFCPPLRIFTIFSSINMIFIFAASSGTFLWYPRILADMLHNHYSSICTDVKLLKQVVSLRKTTTKLLFFTVEQSTNPTQCLPQGQSQVFSISMVMGAIFCIVYFIVGLLLEWTSKRKLFGSIVVLSGIAMSLVGFLRDPWLTTVALTIALCGGCAVAIQIAMIADVYPTSIRATTLSLMFMFGRISSILAGSFVGNAVRPFCQITFYALGMALIFISLLLFFWPGATRAKDKVIEKGYAY